jgi:peroxiredoxin Q/BCP
MRRLRRGRRLAGSVAGSLVKAVLGPQRVHSKVQYAAQVFPLARAALVWHCNATLKTHESVMPEISQAAPDFTLPSTSGKEVTLSALKGQPVVLFFYPRDDTPGCTKESIGFSESRADFEAAGAQVFGISKDSMASHEKFAAKRDLSIPLLSDEHGTVCEDYGVWKEKNMYGKTYMGIERSTFLIAADGTVAQVWAKVKVPGHVEAVLAAVRAL